MKRKFFLLLVLVPFTGLIAQQNLPVGTIIGVGAGQSRELALKNAREDISSQLSTVSMSIITDITVDNNINPNMAIQFQENISIALYRSVYNSASVMQQDNGQNGLFWAVVILTKNNAFREFNQAVSSAKLAFPAIAAFDFEIYWDIIFK